MIDFYNVVLYGGNVFVVMYLDVRSALDGSSSAWDRVVV